MAEFRGKGGGQEPPSGGFFRIPEPGGGTGITRGPMTKAERGRVARGVYKAARKEAKSITQKTADKKRKQRTKIKEASESSSYEQPRGGGAITTKAANTVKGKPAAVGRTPDGSRLTTPGNPFASSFKLKMRAAAEGRTKGGKLIGHNDNEYKRKK